MGRADGRASPHEQNEQTNEPTHRGNPTQPNPTQAKARKLADEAKAKAEKVKKDAEVRGHDGMTYMVMVMVGCPASIGSTVRAGFMPCLVPIPDNARTHARLRPSHPPHRFFPGGRGEGKEEGRRAEDQGWVGRGVLRKHVLLCPCRVLPVMSFFLGFCLLMT